MTDNQKSGNTKQAKTLDSDEVLKRMLSTPPQKTKSKQKKQKLTK